MRYRYHPKELNQMLLTRRRFIGVAGLASASLGLRHALGATAVAKAFHGSRALTQLSVRLVVRDVRCELEPIGPMEKLAPGASASFLEEWRLEEFPFPAKGQSADLQKIADAAQPR